MSALFAFMAIVAVVASALIGTNVASADSIQVQSYQRASQSEACTAQPGETPWQASWGSDSSWSPSWEQWANSGDGGWVCTRSITWARTPAVAGSSGGSGSVTYRVGDIGPGGGLVFLISDGLSYEMAPKTWSSGITDPNIAMCNIPAEDVAGASGIAIGTGSTNTTAMVAKCASGAANSARAYLGGGYNDWFLPSKDELNAMYSYKSSIVDVANYGFKDGAFDFYWSSSQFIETVTPKTLCQYFFNGIQFAETRNATYNVRPVRAF